MNYKLRAFVYIILAIFLTSCASNEPRNTHISEKDNKADFAVITFHDEEVSPISIDGSPIAQQSLTGYMLKGPVKINVKSGRHHVAVNVDYKLRLGGGTIRNKSKKVHKLCLDAEAGKEYLVAVENTPTGWIPYIAIVPNKGWLNSIALFAGKKVSCSKINES